MLIGVIQKPGMDEMAALLRRMDTAVFDLLELRLDACEDLDLERLAQMNMPLPAIFTLRRAEEGGAFRHGEEHRLALLERLIRLKPAYLDVEAAVATERIAAIRSIIRTVSPRTRLILSYHDFEATPPSLEAVLSSMQVKAPDAIYKIATRANSTLDALRMLLFCTQQRRAGVETIGICMGPDGESTRILAPVAHTGLCYCPVEEVSAPGQLTADLLRNVYNFKSLNPETNIYGLLGNPVDQSIGHLHHNRLNAEGDCQAVYVKWRLEPEELGQALPLLHDLGVRGLSVTMPLKEAVMPLLAETDADARTIGASNTLIAIPGGWRGGNTDGRGALECLPMDVRGKHIVILGAGGAAKSVMVECVRQGALVRVYNRSVDKPLPVPVPLLPLREVALLGDSPYDALINALPFDADFNFNSVPFRTGSLAMDCSYAKNGFFLEEARKAGCTVVDGMGMYVAQAALQRLYWGLTPEQP